MYKALLAFLVVLVLATGAFLLVKNKQTPKLNNVTETSNQDQTPTNDTTPPPSETAQPITFSSPKKSAHYVSNTPAHGTTLTTPPGEVTITFNFDLSNESSMTITNDGIDYGVDDPRFDNNKLVIRRSFDPNAPKGLYAVNYNACWPDGSCHDGNFQFALQ